MNRRTFSKTAAALPVALTALATKALMAQATVAAKPAVSTTTPVAIPEGVLTPDALEVIELDKQAELALPRMDVEFLGKLFADDMMFTHGDQWTGKNITGNTNTKAVWLNSIKNSNGQYLKKVANSHRIEMHGDVAVLAGRSSGRMKASAKQAERDYEIWYVRIYQKRAGRWQLLSHKTVRGPQDATEG